MKKGDLFNWLVQYHCQVNLPEALPLIENGVLYNKKGKYEEGTDNGCPYQGVLIIANGSTLADRLVEDRVIHDEPDAFYQISSSGKLFDYLDRQATDDGAYIYDSVNERITRVAEINNGLPLPRDFPVYDQVPKDFTSENGHLPLGVIGTKTRLAIKMPHAYRDTEAFQVKRSRYGLLGMGKVTHFTRQGLAREFLFAYNPISSDDHSSPRPFIDREQGIIGLLRTYQLDGAGTLYRASEERIDPTHLGHSK